MTAYIDTPEDLTLDLLRRVAWEGEDVELAPTAVARMDESHKAFKSYLSRRLRVDPGALIYGVTTQTGDGASTVLTQDERVARVRALWTAASFGEPFPERVVRGIVLSRLTTLISGHAAVRSNVAAAVAQMLSEKPLPIVPSQGAGDAGEILILGHVFHALSARLELEPKERIALITGAPVGPALVGDAALVGRGRMMLADMAFALSVEAIGAPLDAYACELERLWRDTHDGDAMRRLRELLIPEDGFRQEHQAPVSYRIIPRVLGQMRRAEEEAETAATIGLQSVSDNPLFLPPSSSHPNGTVIYTGGYHFTRACSALDAVAVAWADLCQLAQRHVDQLLQHPQTRSHLVPSEESIKPLQMVISGWAEEARSLVQPTLLSLGAYGQNDVPTLTPLAWRKATAVGRCLDCALAVLATLASHACSAQRSDLAPELARFADRVRTAVPPWTEPRLVGADLSALADAFTAEVTGHTDP